jgi:putative DNA primase/helicase
MTAEHLKRQVSPRDYYAKWLHLPPSKDGWVTTNCPFPDHDDANPSFSVQIDDGGFNCHGCEKKGGDIIDFHCLMHDVTVAEALAVISEEFRVSNGTGKRPPRLKPAKRKLPAGPVDESEIGRYADALWKEGSAAVREKLMKRRGWTEETLRKWQLGWAGKRGYSIPVRDEDGVCWNIRFYRPGQQGRKSTFGSLKDRGANRIFNPQALSNQEIIVCEGEADAITADQHGLSNVMSSTLGASNWDESFSPRFADRDVAIIYDIDDAGRAGVKRIATALSGVARSVKVVVLPLDREQYPKGDVSDYLANHTADDLRALIAQAEPWEQPAGAESSGGVTRRSPSAMQDAVEQLRVDLVQGGFSANKNPFRPAVFADALTKVAHWFTTPAADGSPSVLYRYAGGVYRSNGHGVAHQLIKDILGEHSTETRRTQIVSELMLATLADDSVEINQGRFDADEVPHTWVNGQNGWVRWRDGELRTHTPDVRSTIQIPVEYRPGAECPKIDAFLRDVLPEDCVDLMYQLFGYVLLPTTQFQKAFMFTGEGGNGKSVLLDVLHAFIGSENTANVALQDLTQNRFASADLVDKLVNVQADLDATALKSTGVFKQVVTGDRLRAERKHQSAFHFNPFARLIYSANEIPSSADRTTAFYRRWIIIPFPNTFEASTARPKDELVRELTSAGELSGLLNRALRGLRELHDQHGFLMPASTQEAMAAYREGNEPVRVFFSEELMFSAYIPDGKKSTIGVGELWGRYTRWCDGQNVRPLTRPKFNDALKKEGARQSSGTGCDQSSSGMLLLSQRVWRGVTWAEEEQPHDEDRELDGLFKGFDGGFDGV